MSCGSQKSSSSNSNAHSSMDMSFLGEDNGREAGGRNPVANVCPARADRQQHLCCLGPAVEQADVKLPAKTMSSSDFEAQP